MESLCNLSLGLMQRADTLVLTEQEINRILFKSTPEEAFGPDRPQDHLQELERLKRREIELFAHGSTLSEYYKQKLIPRGFRIKNRPTIGAENTAFCERWCQVLNKASLDLIILVIEEVGEQLNNTRRDILKVEILIEQASSSTDIIQSLDTLKTKLEKIKSDLIHFKKLKFKKVVQDYKDVRVYPWLKQDRKQRKPRKGQTPPTNTDANTSDSEAHSSTERQREAPRTPFLGQTAEKGARKPDGGRKGKSPYLRSQTRQ
ncbi:hypothetical protein FKM82_027208 [Ascaphus truei]